MGRIRSLVNPDVYTVYDLSGKDWADNVWQSSTDILVLHESVNGAGVAKQKQKQQEEEIKKVFFDLTWKCLSVLLIQSGSVLLFR